MRQSGILKKLRNWKMKNSNSSMQSSTEYNQSNFPLHMATEKPFLRELGTGRALIK